MPPVGFEPKISAGERPAAARLLRSWYSFLEAESTPGHMELSDAPEKIPRINPGTLRLVAQCLNHYANPAPSSHRPRLNFRRVRGGFWQFGTCLVLYFFLIVACSITGPNTTCLIVIDTNTTFTDSYIDYYTL